MHMNHLRRMSMCVNFVRTTVEDQHCLRSTAEHDDVVALTKITNWRSANFNLKNPKHKTMILFCEHFLKPVLSSQKHT